MPVKFTPEKAIKAWVMHDQGFTGAVIAKEAGCHRDTVRAWVALVNTDKTLLQKAQKQTSFEATLPPEEPAAVAPAREGSKRAVVEAWIRDTPLGTHADYNQQAKKKNRVATGYFSTLRTRLWKTEEHPVRASPPPQPPTPAEFRVTQAEINAKVCDNLEQENKFLRWWNLGERHGWVDRLLAETAKPARTPTD